MSSTVQTISRQLAEKLIPVLQDTNQAWFEAELLVGFVLKHDRTWIVMHPDEPLSKKQLSTLLALAQRRAQHEPIAYLIQRAPFCDATFFVDSRVLIPRAESEQLVTRACTTLLDPEIAPSWAVLDIGTGSGCLGLSIKRNVPNTDLLLSDRSRGALTVAKQNALELGIKQVQFCGGSLLSRSVKTWLNARREKAWMIIANLPYLPFTDREEMTEQVVRYEPANALFANKKGTELIEQLLKQLTLFLKNRRAPTYILLEYDPRQTEDLTRIAKQLFPAAQCSAFADQNGDVRFLEIKAAPSPHK